MLTRGLLSTCMPEQRSIWGGGGGRPGRRRLRLRRRTRMACQAGRIRSCGALDTRHVLRQLPHDRRATGRCQRSSTFRAAAGWRCAGCDPARDLRYVAADLSTDMLDARSHPGRAGSAATTSSSSRPTSSGCRSTTTNLTCAYPSTVALVSPTRPLPVREFGPAASTAGGRLVRVDSAGHSRRRTPSSRSGHRRPAPASCAARSSAGPTGTASFRRHLSRLCWSHASTSKVDESGSSPASRLHAVFTARTCSHDDDMVGRDGHRSPPLPHERLSALLGRGT